MPIIIVINIITVTTTTFITSVNRYYSLPAPYQILQEFAACSKFPKHFIPVTVLRLGT